MKEWESVVARSVLDMPIHFPRHRHRYKHKKNPGDHEKSSGFKSYCASSSLGSYAVSCLPFVSSSSLTSNS